MLQHTAQLERETEKVRSDLATTLDELRYRITPGQLMDQVADYARDGEIGTMARNLRQQAVENPLALCLIGAGMAWLMMPRRASTNGSAARAADRMSDFGRTSADTMTEAAGAAGDVGRTAADSMSDAASRIGERTSAGISAIADTGSAAGTRIRDVSGQLANTASSVSEAASHQYARLSQSASGAAAQIKDTASSLSRGVTGAASSASQNFISACRDQPLILAGLGLAIGAAIGASLPRSESEDRLMGATSDDLKEQAQEFAGDQIGQAKETADQAMGEMAQASSTGNQAQGGREAPSIVPLGDAMTEGQQESSAQDRVYGDR
jgi:hypothetical protein